MCHVTQHAQTTDASCERTSSATDLGFLPELQVALRPQTSKENRTHGAPCSSRSWPCNPGIANFEASGPNLCVGQIFSSSGSHCAKVGWGVFVQKTLASMWIQPDMSRSQASLPDPPRGPMAHRDSGHLTHCSILVGPRRLMAQVFSGLKWYFCTTPNGVT